MRLWLEQFLQDLRFGFRNLAKSPGLTSLAVLSLALGIGASTAMFSVIYGVVIDPFPYKDVDHLMSVKVCGPGQRGFRSYYSVDQFLEIAERSTIFSGVVASTISDVVWTGEGDPQRLRGNIGTPNTFQVMGVPPLLGRSIQPFDGAPGATPVVVLGYKFWQRQFGGAPNVLGRQLRLNDQVRTVVGVMPKRFMWRGADVYLPVTFQRGHAVEGVTFVHLLGRLKPGVTDAQVEADLSPIIVDLKRREPAQFPDKWRVGLLSFKESFPSGIREALWILFGAVGLLLLIACANVSNLLLSKAAGRQKEMAVRAALGAVRARLFRQLLTESLLLALAGAAAGALLAFGGIRAILAAVPRGTIPDESDVALNLPVLAFTLAAAIATALLFGIAPALHTCSANLADPLKAAARGAGGGTRQRVLRGALVVTEVALSLMLLVGASLMIRTLIAMQNVPLGFRPERVLTMRVPLSEQRYPEAARRNAFWRDLLSRVAAIPGVSAAGVNTLVHPFWDESSPIEVAGSAVRDSRPAIVHQTSPDYPKALAIALLQGRMFNEQEAFSNSHLAVVNQAFTRRYLDGREPLGQVIRISRLRMPPDKISDDAFQIVGVVNDTLNRGITNEVMPEVYIPYTLAARADRLVVAANMDPAALVDAVRRQVYAISPAQPVTAVNTLEEMLREDIFAGPQFNLLLFSVFAGLGLALAVIGVYGVVSNSVAQQTREIGVRIALGASFADVVRMVLTGGFQLLAAGIGLGLLGSLLSVRLLQQQIWNVSPFDAVSFAAVSGVLLIAGLQACFWPARRAARVDPMKALRYE